MRPHGEYHIELEGNIVHVYPIGGFNEEGIKALRKEVLAYAPTELPWLLFEHPKDLAGLTPESALALSDSYREFISQNCKGIALEVCSTWRGVIEKIIAPRVSLPIYMSEDPDELLRLIQQ